MVLASMISVLAPWPLKFIIDSVLTEPKEPLPSILAPFAAGLDGNPGGLIVLFVVLGLVLVLLQHAMALFDNFVNTKLELNMALDFRSDLFNHLQKLSLAFHEQR